MQAFLLVGLGGALGAVARYGVSVVVGHFWRTQFPVATMLINVSGSFAMGLLVGWLVRALPPGQSEIRLFVAVGILGGFTTFSAFSLDVMTLIERGDVIPAVIYALGSVLLSVLALLLGLMIFRSLPA
jgi:fluoride exporter